MMHLRKRLLTSAIVFGLGSPAMAADLGYGAPSVDPVGEAVGSGLLLSGIGEFVGGYRWVDSDEDGQGESPIVGGAGRFNVPVTNNFSLQFDADGEYYITDDEEDAQGLAMAGAHASWRNPDAGLLGVFAAVGQGFNESDQDERRLGWMVGGEGQVYLGDVTLYGQAGFADFAFEEGPDEIEGFVEGWLVRGVGRWFVGADSMIEGEVSYGETDTFIDGDDAGKFWNWGIEGKMRITEAMPLYGVVGYRGGFYDSTSEGDTLTDHVVFGGLTILTGAGSLRENDRRGATLDLPLLPGRAASVMQGLD